MLLHYRVKHKILKMLQLLYQFLMTQLCWTFMMTLWIVNQFENTFYEFGTLCSKWPPLARMQAWRRALHQLRHQLHSVEAYANSLTSWTRDWYTRCWTRQ